MTQVENSPPAQTAKPARGLAAELLRGVVVSLGLGALFAWLGVYGTGEIPIIERWVYWSGLMALGIASAAAVNPMIFDRWMKDNHPALQIAAVALAISVPVTAGLVLIEFAVDGRFGSPVLWWIQYFYVVIIAALLTTGGWAADRLREGLGPRPVADPTPPAGDTIQAPVALPALADRLPPKFRSAEVYAVSAEDHYLRVHTSAGETMILMRLADAIRELTTLEGMQTHRSWWVARQGMADAARGDGKVTLKLKSGVEAPVSRTYLKAVKDAGWL